MPSVSRRVRRQWRKAENYEQTTRPTPSEFRCSLMYLLLRNCDRQEADPSSTRAYARIGSSYQKQDDLANAIKFYSKSLTEHRTPDVLAKLRAAEKAKAEGDKQAYIDPERAEAARAEGNDLFKKGDFAGAVKSYTEAIKRQP